MPSGSSAAITTRSRPPYARAIGSSSISLALAIAPA